MAVGNHFTKGADNIGFSMEIHGQIRIIPVAQHTKAHKVFFLAFHLLCRIFTAFLTEFRRRNFLVRFTYQTFHFQFNRQTVAVPAWDIRGIKTQRGFGFHDNVFQNFIHCMTDMNGAVGIRRAVV